MQEIDDEKVTEMVEYLLKRDNYNYDNFLDKRYPFLGWKICDGPAHIYNFEDGSIWLIVREGVGWHRDKPTKTPIQVKYGRNKDGGFLAGGGADIKVTLTPEDFRKLAKPELVPIESESVVRRFGMRLEGNLQANIRAIKKKQQEIKLLSEEE